MSLTNRFRNRWGSVTGAQFLFSALWFSRSLIPPFIHLTLGWPLVWSLGFQIRVQVESWNSEPHLSHALNGVPLDSISHLCYSGLWLDSALHWSERSPQVSQSTFGRHYMLCRGFGTCWASSNSHPPFGGDCSCFSHYSMRRKFDARQSNIPPESQPWIESFVISPSLPSTPSQNILWGVPNNWVIPSSSPLAPPTCSVILPSQRDLWRRCGLFRPRDIIFYQIVGPFDILRDKLLQLDKYTSLPTLLLQWVGTRSHRIHDPVTSPYIVAPRILATLCPRYEHFSPEGLASYPWRDLETATWSLRLKRCVTETWLTDCILDKCVDIQKIRQERNRPTLNGLYIFAHDSIDGQFCGTSILCTYSVRLIGHHSSTQCKLGGQLFGCRRITNIGSF